MRAIELGVFTIAFAVAGLVVFALLWSGPGPYVDLMTGPPPTVNCVMLFGKDGRESCYVLPRLALMHQAWSAYVTGASSDPPTFPDVRFTADEYAHMADVRLVFDGAKFAAAAGALVIIIRLQRARARGPAEMWRVVRGGTLAAAAGVVLVGLIAVVAFEPLFLAFHYVFFPQGNFLFDPATSNLVRLYPDWYWEGMTLRVGASFIALALALAGLATVRLRAAK